MTNAGSEPERIGIERMHLASFLVTLAVLIYVLTSTPVRGLGRLLAPDFMAVAVLFAIFGVRPLFADRFAKELWYEAYTPSQAGENIALTVGIAASISFAVGTFLTSHAPMKSRLDGNHQSGSKRPYRGMTSRHIAIFTMYSILIYAVLLVAISGPAILGQLRMGRSADVAIGQVPEIVMMIPLSPSLLVAMFLLTNRDRKLSKSDLMTAFAAIALSLALLSQLGNRRFIIPAILIPLIAALIRKPTRLKAQHVLLGTVAFLLLAILPMVRSTGARLPGETLMQASWRYFQQEGLSGTVRPIFVSFDTEMFDYIAILAPTLESADFGWGRGTALEFIMRPLPGSRLNEDSWSDQLLTRLFGGGCGDPVCPVASYPGVLYFDGGYTFVVIGCVLLGALLRYMAILWHSSKTLSLHKLMTVVIVSAFALVAIRTNTIHATWWVIYTILIYRGLFFAITHVRLSRLNTKQSYIFNRKAKTKISHNSASYDRK